MASSSHNYWILASVAASSFSNFLVSVAIFKTTGTPMQTTAALVVLSTVLATLGILRASGTLIATRHVAKRQSVTQVLTILVAAGVVISGVVSIWLTRPYTNTGSSAIGLVVLGLGVFPQEGIRIRHFSQGRPQRALFMDCVWIVAMIPPVYWLTTGGHLSGSSLLAWWSGGGAVSSAIGALLNRRGGQGSLEHAWISQSLRTSLIAGIPAASALVSTSLLNSWMPQWFGDDGFISYRAAQTACTPIALLTGAFPAMLLGATAIGTPVGKSRTRLASRFAALVAAVAAMIWALVTLFPPTLWQSWLGTNAQLTVDLIPSVAVGSLGVALVAIPATIVGAFRSASRGSAMLISARWTAVAGLAVPGSRGVPIVIANWISAAVLWATALGVTGTAFIANRRREAENAAT